jgi:hypothetical protein
VYVVEERTVEEQNSRIFSRKKISSHKVVWVYSQTPRKDNLYILLLWKIALVIYAELVRVLCSVFYLSNFCSHPISYRLLPVPSLQSEKWREEGLKKLELDEDVLKVIEHLPTKCKKKKKTKKKKRNLNLGYVTPRIC